MADTTALIVPMNVAALCVGRPDAAGDGLTGPAMTHAPAADFSVLPYVADGVVHNRGPYLAASVIADGEAFQGTVPLSTGIHLHWALPDGLTHGIRAAGPGPGAALALPAAPDRWLVTRVLQVTPPAGPATTTLRSWVVEADRLSPEPTAPPGLAQPTVPTEPGRGQNFRYLGHAFDLADWRENAAAERLSPLTAVGYGEPTFAALYSESSTVFGFLDSLADLTGYDPAHSTVGYHVLGWYSAAAADPLSGGGLDPADNRYQWSYSGGPAPRATLCSGLVDAIPWNPDTRYLDTAAGPLKIAIGPSTQEALSALLAQSLNAAGAAAAGEGPEQLLNALQFNLLTATGPDAIAAFEDAVHEAGFAAQAGGTVWSARTADADGRPVGGPVTLPAALAGGLDALNARQAALDGARTALQAERNQLFTDWCKYETIAYGADDQIPAELTAALGRVRGYLGARIDTLGRRVQAIGVLVDEVGSAAGTLRAALPAGLLLDAQSTATRFHRPADPVLILAGRDVVATTRYGGDGLGSPNGYLACRLDTQLVSGLALPSGAVPGSAAIALPATDLPAPAAPSPADLPAGVPGQAAALLREAVLLAPGTQPTVAAALAALGGPGNPALLDPAATLALLRAAATAFVAGKPVEHAAYTGTAPAPLLFAEWTATPWMPVLLQYEVELQPVQYVDPRRPRAAAGGLPYPPDFVIGQFALDPESVDLVYSGTRLQSTVQLFTGSVPLSPRAADDLTDAITRFEAAVGTQDPELAEALALLARLPLLSQGLSGLGDAMLMQRVALRLPVADPLAPPPDQALVAAVRAAIGPDGTAPLPENSFNPLRCGALRVTRLRLVDVFGRYKDYPAPPTVVAHSITPEPDLALAPGTAFLPPRITQPARLLFDWLDPDGLPEPGGNPAASPVIGWMITDDLDGGVLIHGADGGALGALTLDAGRGRVLWTPAPGGPFPPGTPIDEVLGEAGPLGDAALALYADGEAVYLAPFVAAVRTALATVLPARFRQDVATAVLAGRPLVLARARLALDLFGPVAADQSWGGFADTVLRGAPPADLGLGEVRIPVRLGDPGRLDDSLVGFWLGVDGEVDYGTFYTPAALAGAGPVRRPSRGTVALTPGGGVQITATLLLDPRGSVRAATGALPARTLAIPPDQYATAAAALRIALPVHPVLSGSNTGGLRLPRPKAAAGTWGFVTASESAWHSEPTTDAAAGGAAALDYTPQRIADGWITLSAPATTTGAPARPPAPAPGPVPEHGTGPADPGDESD